MVGKVEMILINNLQRGAFGITFDDKRQIIFFSINNFQMI